MIRLLLGMLLGAALATMARNASGRGAGGRRSSEHVDELSSAADNVIADPPVNVGDGTPGRTSTTGV